MKVEALVTVWFRPFQGVGEPEPPQEELCRFVAGGPTLDAIRVAVQELEPVLRRSAFRRIDKLDIRFEPLDRMRGFYGHLRRALADPNSRPLDGGWAGRPFPRGES